MLKSGDYVRVSNKYSGHVVLADNEPQGYKLGSVLILVDNSRRTAGSEFGWPIVRRPSATNLSGYTYLCQNMNSTTVDYLLKKYPQLTPPDGGSVTHRYWWARPKRVTIRPAKPGKKTIRLYSSQGKAKQTSKIPEWVTAPEYAVTHGITMEKVRGLIAKGKLLSMNVGDTVLVQKVTKTKQTKHA